MTLTWLQRISSIPRQIAIGLGCWSGRDIEAIDGQSLSSSFSISNEKDQIVSNQRHSKGYPPQNYLRWPDHHFAISEYNWDEDHFIDLGRYPVQDRLIARALSDFGNTRIDYSDPEIPYEESFDLEIVFENLQQLVQDEPGFQWKHREYYIVAYYSTLRSDLVPEDRKKLADLDEAAFREALPSKAFIRYWFGRPDKQGRNLATCFWTNREDARKTLANGPYHRRAAREGEGLYQKGTIDIREYALTIDEDVKDWSIKLLSRRIHT